MTNEEMRAEIAEAKRAEGMMRHLTSNFYPPIPGAHALVPTALEAIDTANTYSYQFMPGFNPTVDLPEGMTVNGSTKMLVSDVIEWLCLEDQIKDKDKDKDEDR